MRPSLHSARGVRSSLIKYSSIGPESDNTKATIDSKNGAVGVMVKVVGENGRGSGAEQMTVIVVGQDEE